MLGRSSTDFLEMLVTILMIMISMMTMFSSMQVFNIIKYDDGEKDEEDIPCQISPVFTDDGKLITFFKAWHSIRL